MGRHQLGFFKRHREYLLPTRETVTLRKDHATKPGWESLRSMQLGQAHIRRHERFLYSVLRLVLIAEDAVSVPHGHVPEAAHELVIGLSLSRLRLLDVFYEGIQCAQPVRNGSLF